MSSEKIPDEFVLNILFERGIKFAKKGEGFRLKHHEELSAAPLSPFKFNLCTPWVRPEGRLTDADINSIGNYLWEYMREQGVEISSLVGIPNGGVPIAKAMQSWAYECYGLNIPHLTLIKEERVEKRTIKELQHNTHYTHGPLLPVDDVVFGGRSKLEAIQAIRKKARYTVSRLLVLLDYECGAEEMLSREMVTLCAPLTVTRFFDYAEERGLERHQVQQAKEFLENSRKFLAA